MYTGIMVAPNGARLKYDSHEKIPLSLEQIATTAKECEQKGANAIHLHIRDEKLDHLLDVDKYKQTIDAIKKECTKEFLIQVTTEAVGKYKPQEMIALIKELRPKATSVAIKELIPTDTKDELKAARDFYRFSRDENIGVQHILYSVEDIKKFHRLLEQDVICGDKHSILFVLGRYVKDEGYEGKDLLTYLYTLKELNLEEDVKWMLCAFGQKELGSLVAASLLGGHCRIGFENSRVLANGDKAKDNPSQVKLLRNELKTLNQKKASPNEMREILGIFK